MKPDLHTRLANNASGELLNGIVSVLELFAVVFRSTPETAVKLRSMGPNVDWSRHTFLVDKTVPDPSEKLHVHIPGGDFPAREFYIRLSETTKVFDVNNLNDVKKIDTYKTVFQSEALSIDQIDELFRGHTTRIPGVKMYVSGKLDIHADFTKQFDNCIAFSDDEFRNLVTGNYMLRSNDVIITSGDQTCQTLIVSCCGRIEL